MGKRNIQKHIEEGQHLIDRNENFAMTMGEFYNIAGVTGGNGKPVKYKSIWDAVNDSFLMGVAVGMRISKNTARRKAEK